MFDRSGTSVNFVLTILLIVTGGFWADSGSASEVPTIDKRMPIGATSIDIAPSDLGACSATGLTAPTDPQRGSAEVSSQAGHIDYEPTSAFWSTGGDAFYVSVEGCAGVTAARVRVEAESFAPVSSAIDFEDPQYTPWSLPTGSRLARSQDAALNGGWGLELDATNETNVQPVDIDWDDHGNTNGGSLIVRIEEDDNGGPGSGLALLGTVLWRVTDGQGATIADLALESPSDDITFRVLPLAGAAGSCVATLEAGVHDLAVEFWDRSGTSGGRLRIDGETACEVPAAGTLAAVALHEVGDVTGAGTVGFHLDDLAVHDGAAEPRRDSVSAGYFHDTSGWSSLPANLWGTRTDVVANETWAQIQAGDVFTDTLASAASRWVADFALDPATLSVSQPVTVLKAIQTSGGVAFSLRLRRTVNDGDQLRLVEGGTGAVSPWVDLPAGPMALTVQFSNGIDDANRPSGWARLWHGETVLAEIDGLGNTDPVDEVRYGLWSQGSAGGYLLLGPLESWVDEP